VIKTSTVPLNTNGMENSMLRAKYQCKKISMFSDKVNASGLKKEGE